MARRKKPKLAVWKFASCDGCQLSLLDCEDELLEVAGEVQIAYFPEATRAVVRGPYDVYLVEGWITTPHDAERMLAIRRKSKLLITFGGCSTAGVIQAMSNFT
ncbi:MAG: oxidoreductase, partial [Rhodothermales bacterium]|nr:oxidoreductase [Rhodothermales bacterium]